MPPEAPKDGEYQEGHLWFERRGSLVTIGLTGRAIEDLGSVDELDLPDEDEVFEQGDVVATLEGTDGRLEVTTPAAGTVRELNQVAKLSPDIISEDPLEEGWIVKIELQDVSDLFNIAENEAALEEGDDDEDDQETDDEEEDPKEDDEESDHDHHDED